jgi:tetratricopeptide (TPR) repeat protein
MPAPNNIDKLCQRARQAIELRDWQKAKQAYLQALGLKSDLPDVHYGLATVYFQLRELTSAAHHFKEVTRLDPLRAGAFINLGAVLNLLQEYDEAIVVLRRGLQIDSTRTEGYYNLGLVYRRKGELDLAIQAYKEALRLNPRMADAHLNLGNIHLEKEQLRQALQHYEQAQQLRPGWDKPAAGIAEVKERMAEDKQAAAAPAKTATVRLGTGSTPDMNLPVDPTLHGDYLTRLHQLTIDAEEPGRDILQVLLKEVEPAIKELSSCLLYVDRPRAELEECVMKFEIALEHMRVAQQSMHERVAKLTQQGEQFPAG